jgi:LPXTG-motif cell wall-anchored protein
MKKSLTLALGGLMVVGGMTKSFAQDDSAKVSEELKDTISIDTMVPTYYEEGSPKESSSTMTYVYVGGIVVIGGMAYFYIKKKKKQ